MLDNWRGKNLKTKMGKAALIQEQTHIWTEVKGKVMWKESHGIGFQESIEQMCRLEKCVCWMHYILHHVFKFPKKNSEQVQIAAV